MLFLSLVSYIIFLILLVIEVSILLLVFFDFALGSLLCQTCGRWPQISNAWNGVSWKRRDSERNDDCFRQRTHDLAIVVSDAKAWWIGSGPALVNASPNTVRADDPQKNEATTQVVLFMEAAIDLKQKGGVQLTFLLLSFDGHFLPFKH